MNDLMYYGRLAWAGSVGIYEEDGSSLKRSCHVLLLEFILEYLLVSMLSRMLG